MMNKKLLNEIVKTKSMEYKKLKKTFDLGLIRNAAFSIGTDFHSAQFALNDSRNIPLIIPLQGKNLKTNSGLTNYEPFKTSRFLGNLKIAVFLVASDQKFLGGDPVHIKMVKTGAEVGVIQHDFFIDEVQLYQAKSYGSDGIMLDSELLDVNKLAALADVAFQLGLEPFLKIRRSTDLQQVEPEIIGGLILEKENIEELLNSQVYQKIKVSAKYQLPVIAILHSLSPLEIEELKKIGIQHFLLNEDWFLSKDALSDLEKMIRYHWPAV